MPRGIYEHKPHSVETRVKIGTASRGRKHSPEARDKLSAAMRGNQNGLKHGHAYTGRPTLTYSVWRQMVRRCGNPKNKDYSYYGGRGITVCERWQSFENFLADMGEKPEGLTIERINNDGNYEPNNCRWATRKEQRANQRGASC